MRGVIFRLEWTENGEAKSADYAREIDRDEALKKRPEATVKNMRNLGGCCGDECWQEIPVDTRERGGKA